MNSSTLRDWPVSDLPTSSLAMSFSLAAPVAAEGKVRIAEFKANLFNSKTGSLSGDILAKGAPEMGAIPSGDFASVSTFITVKVDFGATAAVPQRAQIVKSDPTVMARQIGRLYFHLPARACARRKPALATHLTGPRFLFRLPD